MNNKIDIEDFTTILYNKDKILKHYHEQEQILIELFDGNWDFDYKHIITRVTLLNEFYSTSILDINSMAEHLCNPEMRFKEKLESGDETVVYDISRLKHKVKDKDGKIIEKEWLHTSFATKFASFKNADSYPIYDSLVVKVFSRLKKELQLGDFKVSNFRLKGGYHEYKDVYKTFRTNSGIDDLKIYGRSPNLKEIDNYIWYSRKIADMVDKGLLSAEPGSITSKIYDNWLNKLMRQPKR